MRLGGNVTVRHPLFPRRRERRIKRSDLSLLQRLPLLERGGELFFERVA